MRYFFEPLSINGPLNSTYSLNIFIWSVALCLHAACKNFAGLFVVQLILGMCEGSVTAGFLIISSMFYMRTEQTLRVEYWCAWLMSFVPQSCVNVMQS